MTAFDSHTHSSFIRDFEEGEFLTSLTQALQSPQRGASSMVLNAFAHAAGLEVGSFFDTSAPHISANTREYQYEGVTNKILLVTQLEKLHGSDGCQASRSRLTVLRLQQDLVHGTLLQFHLLIWIILTPSCLSNGFVRLFR